MKMYHGIELVEVTEPQIFNPSKPMLVWNSDNDDPCQLNVCAIVNRDDFRVITERSAWRHCAEIPEQKLATYSEVSRWLAQGNGVIRPSITSVTCYSYLGYVMDHESIPVNKEYLIRKWNDAEWHSPTREYLGLED